jgi:hypothetical protein
VNNSRPRPHLRRRNAQPPTGQPAPPHTGEPVGDQIIAALGYGLATASVLVDLLAPYTDDLGPGQYVMLIALFAVLSMLAVRHHRR